MRIASMMLVTVVAACGTSSGSSKSDAASPLVVPATDASVGCTTGSKRCIGNSVQVCNRDVWITAYACTPATGGTTCVQGLCE